MLVPAFVLVRILKPHWVFEFDTMRLKQSLLLRCQMKLLVLIFWIVFPKEYVLRSFFFVLLFWGRLGRKRLTLAAPHSDYLPHALSPGRVNCVVPSKLKTFSPSSTPECVRSCQAWRAGCAWRATSPRCSREALPRLTITPITMATAVRHRWVVLQDQRQRRCCLTKKSS